jgi:uncharacterized protein (TIGR02147 family)
MNVVSIYQFERYADFISSYFSARKKVDPRFSYEWLCRKAGINAVSTLGMIVSGKRLPSQSLIHKISSALKLTKKETEYAQALVGFEKAKTGEEKQYFANLLGNLRPHSSHVPISLDAFDYIAQWYHLTILEMLNLKDFSPDPEWIWERLGKKISLKEVKGALERLVRLGLIDMVRGEIVRKMDVEAGFNIPSVAVRSFHRGMLMKAQESLETEPIERRYFKGITLAIDSTKMDVAREMINEFAYQFAKAMEAKPGDETYQLSLNFFNLTHKQSKGETHA